MLWVLYWGLGVYLHAKQVNNPRSFKPLIARRLTQRKIHHGWIGLKFNLYPKKPNEQAIYLLSKYSIENSNVLCGILQLRLLLFLVFCGALQGTCWVSIPNHFCIRRTAFRLFCIYVLFPWAFCLLLRIGKRNTGKPSRQWGRRLFFAVPPLLVCLLWRRSRFCVLPVLAGPWWIWRFRVRRRSLFRRVLSLEGNGSGFELACNNRVFGLYLGWRASTDLGLWLRVSKRVRFRLLIFCGWSMGQLVLQARISSLCLCCLRIRRLLSRLSRLCALQLH